MPKRRALPDDCDPKTLRAVAESLSKPRAAAYRRACRAGARGDELTQIVANAEGIALTSVVVLLEREADRIETKARAK